MNFNIYTKNRQTIMSTKKIIFIMAILIFASLTLAQVVTQGGTISTSINFRYTSVILAILSAFLVGLYGFYHKSYYLYGLMVVLIAASSINVHYELFTIDGKLEGLFLGFYLILVLGSILVMVTSKVELKRKSFKYKYYFRFAFFVVAIYGILKGYVFKNLVVFQSDALWMVELLLVATIPFMYSFYYGYYAKKKDLFAFSVYFSTLSFFVTIVTHSVFIQTMDYRFEFLSNVFENIVFGGYIILIPLSFLETVKDKDEIIRKSNVLKNNLFMFFKSAEYNENITVFVNSNHEVLYSNATYKLFFNNHGNELESELSNYLTEKYEVIKYNMNYSSSIKIEKQNHESILDVDVVFIEQNEEEIFCITAKDSTVIRAMQESLKRSEYKYRSFFNLIPDFIYLYDLEDNKIIEANDMVYSNFKITSNRGGDDDYLEDNFMGLSFRELGELGRKIKPGEIHKLETMKIKNVKGEDFYVEPSFRVLSFEDHQKQMLVFYKDITSTIKLHELRISHEANIRELVIARENEKMFNEFFANMSHELRTPINIILSALEMMELSPSDHEKAEKYGQFIRHNAYRLTRIVNNILDITKVDSGFYNLNMKNYELVGFVEDIVTSIVHYAHGKGIKIIFDTEEEEYYVAFDMEALERVLLNLLSNAIKFSHEGDSIYVFIHLDKENQKVYIDVKDNGIGIPKDNVDKIFDRFIQVNKSTTRDNEGTGIGLSIVKKLMVLMGGDCEVKSELGVGTQFRIVLKDEVLEEAGVEEVEEFIDKRDNRVEIEFSDLRKS